MPDNVTLAMSVLDKISIRYDASDVLLVEIPGQPGGFRKICERLAAEHLNIDYAYCSFNGGGKVKGGRVGRHQGQRSGQGPAVAQRERHHPKEDAVPPPRPHAIEDRQPTNGTKGTKKGWRLCSPGTCAGEFSPVSAAICSCPNGPFRGNCCPYSGRNVSNGRDRHAQRGCGGNDRNGPLLGLLRDRS